VTFKGGLNFEIYILIYVTYDELTITLRPWFKTQLVVTQVSYFPPSHQIIPPVVHATYSYYTAT